jgi:hypothetical protein
VFGNSHSIKKKRNNGFVKHDLEEVLKCTGVEIDTPQTVIDIAAKSDSTVGILRKTMEFKIPVLTLFPDSP